MSNQLLLKYGIVCDVKPGYSKVHLTEENIVTDWMPVVTRKSKGAKESWQFEINEQVVCLVMGSGDEGVVLGACCNNEDPPDEEAAPNKMRILWPDGTIIEYNSEERRLKVECSGDLLADVAKTATIKAMDLKCTVQNTVEINAATIRIVGEIQIDGDINCTGSITGNQVKTGLIDLATHKHIGVQPGGGASGTPI